LNFGSLAHPTVGPGPKVQARDPEPPPPALRHNAGHIERRRGPGPARFSACTSPANPGRSLSSSPGAAVQLAPTVPALSSSPNLRFSCSPPSTGAPEAEMAQWPLSWAPPGPVSRCIVKSTPQSALADPVTGTQPLGTSAPPAARVEVSIAEGHCQLMARRRRGAPRAGQARCPVGVTVGWQRHWPLNHTADSITMFHIQVTIKSLSVNLRMAGINQ
jgi:hypothetical protein